MHKNRQYILTNWLKLQSNVVRDLLRISTLFGLLNTVIIVFQSWLIAILLQELILSSALKYKPINHFVILLGLFTLRAVVSYYRNKINFVAGAVLCNQIRNSVLDRLERLGPSWIRTKPAGTWSTMIIEQILGMHDYYAHYLPQVSLSVIVPATIIIVICRVNWVAGLILFVTAPLIPLFMILVGTSAADANRRNFLELARLSGYFLDKLRGLETLRLFFRAELEIKNIKCSTEKFRKRTMEVLKLAFLSSSVLEFFASIAVAITAAYFGFSYLGELNFGSYDSRITLFDGFVVLILAPEFFQPLRDLGAFYHAKAQAIGAAESLVSFLEQDEFIHGTGQIMPDAELFSLTACDVWIITPDGTEIAGPLNFAIKFGQRIAIVGASGSGKSSLLGVLMGFLPYRGSLKVNNCELRLLSPMLWRKRISWVGQNVSLPASTLRSNIVLGYPAATDVQINEAIHNAYITEFIKNLPNGLDSVVGENADFLSAGQAQRIALARALIRSPDLLLLDEPTANLDIQSVQMIMHALKKATRRYTTLLVTHQLQTIVDFDSIWVMDNGIIVQRGRYNDLATSSGPLANLIASRI